MTELTLYALFLLIGFIFMAFMFYGIVIMKMKHYTEEVKYRVKEMKEIREEFVTFFKENMMRRDMMQGDLGDIDTDEDDDDEDDDDSGDEFRKINRISKFYDN